MVSKADIDRLRRRVSGRRDDSVKKKKDAGSRSWILMNATGQEMDLPDVDKYDIMKRARVDAHDLRILDPMLSYPSAILSRDRAIVLNLEHIKAIITADEVLIRDQLDDNVVPMVEELRRRLNPVNFGTANGQSHGVNEDVAMQKDDDDDDQMLDEEDEEYPFEFTALEVALEAICSYLGARAVELEAAVYPAMEKLTSKVTSLNLAEVRKLKGQVARLTARVQKVRDELKQLLSDDVDMARLYLSKRLPGAAPSPSPRLSVHNDDENDCSDCRSSVPTEVDLDEVDDYDVQELEVLLEAYFTHIDGTLNKLIMQRDHINNTEAYLNLKLNQYRNQLMEVQTILDTTMFSLAIVSTWCQLMGMSIPFSWNDPSYGHLYKWVVLIPSFISVLIFIIIFYYARRRGLFPWLT